METLEQEIDGLYALEPAEFTAERDRLARELRKVGRRDEADEVKKLRKPTLSAWTINQLARQERRAVDLLLDAGHRLRDIQQGLVPGDDVKSLDEARQTEQTALADLREAASRILVETGRGNAATLDRIAQTLHAAAISSEGRELLARGRLTGDLDVTGFELLGSPSTSRAKQPGRQRKSTQKKKGSARTSSPLRGRKRLEEARRELREAQAKSDSAKEAFLAAKQGAKEAHEQLQKAEEKLLRAEEGVERAFADVVTAKKAVDQAHKKLGEAERDGR